VTEELIPTAGEPVEYRWATPSEDHRIGHPSRFTVARAIAEGWTVTDAVHPIYGSVLVARKVDQADDDV